MCIRDRLGPAYTPNDPSHGPRTEAYDNSVLAEALRAEMAAQAKASAKKQAHDAELARPNTVERMLYPTLQSVDGAVRNHVKNLLGATGFASGGLTSGVMSYALARALVNAGHAPGGAFPGATEAGAAVVGASLGAGALGSTGQYIAEAAETGLDGRMSARLRRMEN